MNLLIFCLSQLSLAGGQEALAVEIDPGAFPRKQSTVEYVLERGQGPVDGKAWSVTVTHPGGELPVQVSRRRGADERTLSVARWIEPSMQPGVSRRATLKWSGAASTTPAFTVEERDGGSELSRDGRCVWRHVTAFEPDGDFESTYKTFHHLYGPGGDVLLTKGVGGKYSHHRGLFVGWKRTRVGETNYNFWHWGGGEQRDGQRAAREPAHAEMGPVHATVRSAVDWLRVGGSAVVSDERTLTTWNVGPDEHLIDFEVELKAGADPVRLGGDPAHAGVHLRFAQEVADGNSCRYVLPKSANDEGGDNWTEAGWVAALVEIEGKPFTVLFLDGPDNGVDVTWNTRAYGRFGAFFELALEAEQQRRLRYRMWIGSGHEDDRKVLTARWTDYVEPVVVRGVQ
ncbi:MAG: hypothetical protein GY711_17110 [bacterium]|nr:hypothetical protein [bacterium]